MEVLIEETAHNVAKRVADFVERLIVTSPAPVLGLATGATPVLAYQELIRRYRAGTLSFERTRVFLLDEYVGLAAGHPGSYGSTIRRELIDHIDMATDALMVPASDAASLRASSHCYDAEIRDAGGIDLQLLGIGSQGHIGFNEPGSSLSSRTRIKTLAASTRRDNGRFFGGADEVPRHAVTQGIGTILDARQLLLIAIGSTKAKAVAAAVEGPITSMVPASALQLHPHATVVLDHSAAADLQLAEYYAVVQRHKPQWLRPEQAAE